MKNGATGKYLDIDTSSTPYTLTYVDACATTFHFNDVTEISVQVTEITPYHLKVLNSDDYLDNVDKVQVQFNTTGTLWELLPV